jgi:SAM-dependent methyltransferase
MVHHDETAPDQRAADTAQPIRPHSPEWDPFRDTAMGSYLLEREQSFLSEALVDVDPLSRLLDIGSGTGRVTEPLRRRPGPVVIGLDADLQSLVSFSDRAGMHPAVLADAVSLPFAAGSFDAAVAIQCFRYFEPHSFLGGCNRVLRPGGRLIIQAVNRSGYKRAVKRALNRSSVPPGSHVFTTVEVLRLLRQHGFSVEDVRGYNWPPFKPRFSPWSDSPSVRYADLLERRLHLDRSHRLSPWILVAGTKLPA